MDKHKLMVMRGIITGGSYFVLILIFNKFELFVAEDQKYIQSIVIAFIVMTIILMFDYVLKKKYPKELKRMKLEQNDERAMIAQGKAAILTLKVLIVLGIVFVIAMSISGEHDGLLYIAWAFIVGVMTNYVAYSFYEAQ